jgi:hypothetical protein
VHISLEVLSRRRGKPLCVGGGDRGNLLCDPTNPWSFLPTPLGCFQMWSLISPFGVRQVSVMGNVAVTASEVIEALSHVTPEAPDPPIPLPGAPNAVFSDSLLPLLQTWKSDPLVVLATLQAVNRVTRTSGEGQDAQNRRVLGEKGACQTVAEATRAWPTDEAVQLEGLACIQNLAREEENEEHLLNVGAWDVVTNAMTAFPNNRELQEQACGAVWTLAMDAENLSR